MFSRGWVGSAGLMMARKRGDINVGGSETTRAGVVGSEGILACPVPARGPVAGLEVLKVGLDALDVGISVLLRGVVEVETEEPLASWEPSSRRVGDDRIENLDRGIKDGAVRILPKPGGEA